MSGDVRRQVSVPTTRLALAAATTVVALAGCSPSNPRPYPRVFAVSPTTVATVRSEHNPAVISRAVHDADQALQTQPHSVVEKTQTPPSGDKHDWYSQAGYWWPDPDNPSGPYVRHDGVSNPEKGDYTDERYLRQTVGSAEKLGLAFYLTGDEKYAEHAALLLRTWFINPATVMNPNLTYAQFVKGRNDGRSAGIVSARTMPEALDAVGYLRGSKNWTHTDDEAMRRWFGSYYTWLTTSPAGQSEGTKKNNHGSWYDVQVASIALYLGKNDDARTLLSDQRRRITSQIDEHGMQPFEMARTKSFSYSAMNIHALMMLAAMAKPLGIDLFHDPAEGGSRLLTAVDALLPYDKGHPWPHEQIEQDREQSLCPALNYAVGQTHDPKYADAVNRFRCPLDAKDLVIQRGV